MKITINAELSDGTVKTVELSKETYYQVIRDGNFYWNEYPTPDLSEPTSSILQAVDNLNYGVMSKTEFTEFLYRISGSSMEWYAKEINNPLVEGMKEAVLFGAKAATTLPGIF